jgi:hypothetical protein
MDPFRHREYDVVCAPARTPGRRTCRKSRHLRSINDPIWTQGIRCGMCTCAHSWASYMLYKLPLEGLETSGGIGECYTSRDDTDK